MRNENRFYRKHMRLKTALSTVAVILLLIVMLLAFIFFWFRRYIVYTEDGLYLDIPLLTDGTEHSSQNPVPGDEPAPEASVPDDTVPPDADGTAEPEETSPDTELPDEDNAPA